MRLNPWTGLKRCSKCGLEKTASEFGPDKRKKDGLRSECRKCKNQQTIARRRQRRHEDDNYRVIDNANRFDRLRRSRARGTGGD